MERKAFIKETLKMGFAAGPERLPETYGHGSEGWVKEVFETASKKNVQVQALQTIKCGANSCKFMMIL